MNAESSGESEFKGSVTQWIQDVKTGDVSAAQQLWNRYFERLIQLAKKKLWHAPTAVSDEEDVALQALASFFDGAPKGRFPQLTDRDDLWSLLASIAEHKAIKQINRQNALKRGGDKRHVDIDWENDVTAPDFPTLEALSLELRELMAKLPDDQLRQIVMLILQGNTSAEIAAKLDISERTVERKRQIIRRRWGNEFE